MALLELSRTWIKIWLLCLMTAGASATEILTNRSFDVADGAGWGAVTNSQFTVSPGAAYLHPVSGYIGTVLWQDLDVTDVGGVTGTAGIVISAPFGAPLGNTIAVYLEYTVTGGTTNRLLLLNPDNATVLGGTTTFSTNFTLPSEAQRIVRLSVDKTANGGFYAQEFSLDIATASPPPDLPAPFYGFINNGEVMITGHIGTSGGAIVIPSTIYGYPVTFIGHAAFQYWDNLTSMTIPDSVTFIGPSAFTGCTNLKSVYFQGNAPGIAADLFDIDSQATVYYVPGTANWGSTFGGRPTAPWVAHMMPPTRTTITHPGAIQLSVAVSINDGRSVNQVQFMRDGTSMGSATRDFHDEWSFPDGSHLSIMGDGAGWEAVDYNPAGYESMYCFDGGYSSTTNFTGNFVTWPSAGTFTGSVSVVFTISSDDRLTAQISGQAPLGTVTLTGGIRGFVNVPSAPVALSDGPLGETGMPALYNFFWNTPSTGTYAVASRVFFTDGSSNDSDTVTMTVESLPTILNGTFETGLLTNWENGSITNTGARNGSYAAVIDSWGPPGFLVQNITPRLQSGIEYTFTAYINIQSNMNLEAMPIPMYFPHLSVGANVFSGSYIAATNSSGLGWQKLELSRSFTAEELATNVYLAVGGMGRFLVDDVSATEGLLPPSPPYAYTTNADDTITITGYTGPGGTVNIPASIDGRIVTGIGSSVFWSYTNLAGIIIPSSVTHIGDYAFEVQTGGDLLKSVYFQGNAPISVGEYVLIGANNAIVYRRMGTTGWGSTFGGQPTALRNPLIRTNDGNFGVRTNGFGFNITGPDGQIVIVETCTNLNDGIWIPVKTNILISGSVDFNDSSATNRPKHYYRVIMPEM